MANLRKRRRTGGYETQAEFDKALSFKSGLTVHVSRNGRRIGRLQISKGGVRWLGSHKSKRGPDLAWHRLVDILKEADRRRRK